MVDPSMPWSLKGISDEAREFAKQSADDAQIPVGAWLSEVIRSAAAQEAPQETGAVPGNQPQAAPQAVPDSSSDQIGSTIERAAQIVDDFGFEPEGPARDADLIDDPVLLQQELLALERRLEESDSQTQDSLTPLVEEIDRIRNRLAAIKKH